MVMRISNVWKKEDFAGQTQPGVAAVLLGAPDDRGVLNVGGRLGAGKAPDAIRAMLGQFMLGIDDAINKVKLYRGHDINPGATIESGHAELKHYVALALKSKVIPIVLGGGHDYGYPHIAGVSEAFSKKVALINIDAHLDVRPTGAAGITSGSPFYLALEHGAVKAEHFVEFGIQEHCNTIQAAKYIQSKKVSVLSLDETRTKNGVVSAFRAQLDRFEKAGLAIAVSFDVDAVQMAFAPGVSAPQVDGFTPAEFFGMAAACGECKSVASIGFFEYAPFLDENQKTVRLVATAIHRYLSALSRRDEMKPKDRSAVRRLLRR